MQVILVLATALAVCGPVTEATTSALRASVFEQYFTDQSSGRWGFLTGCPNYHAVNSICSSGTNADCNREFTRISCSRNAADMLSQHGEPSIVRTTYWGEYATCGQDEVVVGVCSSGRDKDCNFNRGKGPTAIGCHKLSPNYYLSTLTSDMSNQCCSWGQVCTCPPGFYATQVCTAGKDPDCATEICRHRGRIYTGVKCVKVVRKENLVVEGEWDDNGNTVQDTTFEVSFYNEQGLATTDSKTVSNEISASLEVGAEYKFFSASSTVTTTFSESFTREVTRDVRNSVTQTMSSSCSPREDLAGDVEKLGTKWQEYKGFTMPSSALRYFKYRMQIQAGSVSRAVLETCDYLVLYTGMEPKCPPEACQDLPLCQTCCSTGGEIRRCRLSEVIESDFAASLS